MSDKDRGGALLARARTELNATRTRQAARFLMQATSRAYYGAFYAAEAALQSAVAVVLVIASVGIGIGGTHILRGGLYTDDWSITAIQKQSGTWGLFTNLLSANHDRPLAAIYQSIATGASGSNGHLHALFGLLALLSAAVTTYLLLRHLSLRDGEALAIALLVVVFPFADSAWLWWSASHSYLAIALAALGGIAAINSCGACNRRSALIWRATAISLFVASILTYQTAAFVICLSVAIYIPRLSRRRTAILYWLVDIIAVLLALLGPRLITGSSGTTANPIIGPSLEIDHAREIANQGLTLLTYALVPFGTPNRLVVLPIVLLIVIFAASLAWRNRQSQTLENRLIRRWLLLMISGIAVVFAAYAIYIPAPISFYQPLGQGGENRINVLASVGYTAIVVAIAMLVAAMAARALGRSQQITVAAGVVLIAIVFGGYVSITRKDVASWNRAAAIQRYDLSVLRHVGRPPSGTTIYAFGGIGATAPGVYAFRVTWDLNSAVQLYWNDPTLHAYPIFDGTSIECAPTQVIPNGPANGDGIAQAASYGHVMFFDFATKSSRMIDNPRVCDEAQTAYIPGPVEG